ncbi:MAG: hypothetical protein J6I50_05265 [Clostridia bacterium]|nr:hypothetical protein [Clostridia bacterium]
MKQHLIAAVVCLIAAVIGAGYAIVALAAETADVTYRTHVTVGDAENAKGLIIQETSTLDHHAFWNTETRIGTSLPESGTEFAYHTNRDTSDGTRVPNGTPLDFSSDLTFEGGFMSNDNTETETAPDGIAAVYAALYARAPIGEEVREEIKLSDVCTYYPISLRGAGSGVENDRLAAVLNDCFRIPVLEEETYEIHLTRNSDTSTSWGSSSIGADSYTLWTCSVLKLDADATGDGENSNLFGSTGRSNDGTHGSCYVAFSARTQKGKLVDTSEIRDGFGIYKMDCTVQPYRGTLYDADSLSLFCPLPPQTEICDLYLNGEGTQLLLVTKAGEHAVGISVYALESGICTQSITVDIEDGAYSHIITEDGYMVVVTTNALCVLTEDDGVWSEEFTAQTQGIWEDEILSNNLSALVTAFDGQRLAAACGLNRICGYAAAVYTKEGCIYAATMESSLNTPAKRKETTWNSAYDAMQLALRVQWE